MIISKICVKCNEERPFEKFNKHPAARDGRINTCRFCVTALAKINRVKHKERHARKAREKRSVYKARNAERKELLYAEENLLKPRICSTCGATKSTSEFWKDSTRFDGFSTVCGTCNSEKKRQRYRSDPELREKLKEYKKNPESKAVALKWRNNNKERIKELNRRWREKNP